MLGLVSFPLQSPSIKTYGESTVTVARQEVKVTPKSGQMDLDLLSLESEVGELTTERNRLCTQLCDLRTLLRKLTRDLASESQSEAHQIVGVT